MGIVKHSRKGMEFKFVTMNTREDLLKDFRFFFSGASLISTQDGDPEKICAQQRWLRASLLILFAYIEAVVNGWVYFVLESRNFTSVFKRLRRSRLEEKVDFLYDAFAARPGRLDIEKAKRLRDLLVHFKPGRDEELFDNLTLEIIKDAALSVQGWMKEMEAIVGRRRHPFTEELVIDDRDSSPDEGQTNEDGAQ